MVVINKIMNVRPYLKIIMASVLGAILIVSVFSPAIYDVGPFEIGVRAQIWHHGLTEAELTPFGTVRADTHLSPLKISVNLNQINLNELTQFLELSGSDSEEFTQKWENKLLNVTRNFILKIIGLAAIGGFVGTFVVGFRDKRKLLMGSFIGIIIMALIITGTVFGYDHMAFMNPEYEGALESFPYMMGLIEESFSKIGELGQQLELISINLFTLFQRIDEVAPPSLIEGEYIILHVSDIHNNPAAYDFIFQISESFEIDMIIDTGDITDYGTPLEAGLASRIQELEMPYIFIPGNHDSPQVVERMREILNVKVLEEGIVEVLGFKIAGIEDPSSVSSEMTVQSEEVLIDYADRLENVIDSSGVSPHIVGVHHPMIARKFMSDIPVILTGHTHQKDIERKDESILINAGTTGAAGIRGFQVDEDVPYSLALLRMSEDKELLAVDLLEITHLEGGYRVERIIPGNIDIVPQ